MKSRVSQDNLKLCVVADSFSVSDEIAEGIGQCDVEYYELSEILDAAGNPTETMKAVEDAARRSDAVLLEWSLENAPLIGSVGYRLRPFRFLLLRSLDQFEPRERLPLW